jgi:hypothetical protein
LQNLSRRTGRVFGAPRPYSLLFLPSFRPFIAT